VTANHVAIADVCISGLRLSSKIQGALIVAAAQGHGGETGIRLAPHMRLRSFDLLLKQRLGFV